MNEQLTKTLLQCILDLLIELEYADNNQIDPDFCVRTMEIAASNLQQLSHSEIKKIKNTINKIKGNERNADRRRFIEDFIDHFGLE